MTEKRPDETQTAFAIRLLAAEAWTSGHDAACPISLAPCYAHPNPHEDPR